ncbi:glycosyl hydrolase [Luteolibacter luteus]|uniref:Glycoside hydrolase n=1 Tax=Luteolibacter luteus TaxID=2728835 RepID=A0A858RPW5_9BACT|nr:glycosyl hydrolase [Luteolibacter luteus]QJE98554.1 glycoside hydrolase [Luteolibacter luteus]
MKPILLTLLCLSPLARANDTLWPEPTFESKPWTRWWWLGSGVDQKNLTIQLQQFRDAGIGGVEICPIYGAKGYEDRDLTFLSTEWTAAYAHTAHETARLGMGVDLTTGTGWPFGAPWVAEADASASLENVKAKATGGSPISLKLPKGEVKIFSAWPETGEPVDLRGQVKDGRLEWTPPAGTWRLHGIIAKHGIQKVKRAAPGGAGWVLDPFSPQSIGNYLKPFDEALDRDNVPEPRAHFHDSFEYYGAAWTDDLFTRFRGHCGYDLADQLPAFQGEGDSETVARVRADYRATLSELHREYLAKWHDWAKARGSLTRNQAHGSPGNLLDHYAVADIPETEIFRHVGEEQIPMLQFASSAAHVTGRKLVSAETFTWLGEHFQVTPAQLKEAADFVWLGGVNHILFHGIPFTPEDAPWPGWLFYASTHMGPNGGLWKDLPTFNGYIARCQTALQSGKPDSDVLLYFPVQDLWHDGADGLPLFTVHNQDKWLHPTGFYRSAMEMWNHGIACDFVSDRLLEEARVKDQKIELGGNTYKALVVPDTKFMAPATAKRLLDLTAKGVVVIFTSPPPSEAPGYGNREENRKAVTDTFAKISGDGVLPYQSGLVFRNADLRKSLASVGVGGEPMREQGLRFVRRKHDDGWTYFIVNSSGKDFDGTVSLATTAKSAVLFKPMSGESGVIPFDKGLPLKLAAGESVILRTYREREATGPRFQSLQIAGEPVKLGGTWKVRFLDGGPSLPASYETETLASWTGQEDPAYKNFSGTAIYQNEFDWKGSPEALLDLGEIAATAKVRLNGKEVGRCWSPPHKIRIKGELKDGPNTLEVEVTNLAANRIADLDRRKVPWKSFHEINFVNIDYKPFDASAWSPLPSGLIGPVTMTPLK